MDVKSQKCHGNWSILTYISHHYSSEDREEVLQNCHFLKKLAVDNLALKSREVEHICQNGETLQILSLSPKNQGPELIQKLFTKCHQLTEVNLYYFLMSDAQLWALVKNLTPNIFKLNLGARRVKEKHVNTLV